MEPTPAQPSAINRYGQPCRDCGFDFLTAPAAMIAAIGTVHEAFTSATAGATGREQHPDLGWDVTQYVSHVADNLRNWSERFMSAWAAGVIAIGRYDPDELARVRHYDRLALPAALWSLEHSVPMWIEAATHAVEAGTVLEHELRGRVPASDFVASSAHDAWHHVWDVQRTLAVSA